MPWHIERDPDVACTPEEPWAVIKDDDGSVAGCHATEADAQAQLAALYAQEGGSPEAAVASRFEALLVVEGHETADGRLMELDSVTWRDLPVPLMVATETSAMGGHDGAWFGGSIEDIQRDPTEPSRVLASGHFGGPRALEAESYVRAGLRGISVDVSGSEVVVEGFDPDEEGWPTRFLERYGDARIMGATVTPFAAFEETQIWLPDEMPEPEVVSQVAGEEVPHGEVEDGIMLLLASGAQMAAIKSHTTATTDAAWDGPANEANLPSPMSRSAAQGAYAWMSPDATGDEIMKADCKFIHHMVGDNGQPGAANLTACSTGIGVLHGGRGGTSVPEADRKGVYDHLARHLTDGGLEPPPYDARSAALDARRHGVAMRSGLVAACAECAPGYRPPARFFTKLRLSGPTPLTITDDGEVLGHIGIFGTCHTGVRGRCQTPPHSQSGYAYFNTGEVICDDGSRVAVGHISMCTDPDAMGHEYDLYATVPKALAHYDNTGLVVADVHGGEDDYGPWVHGALRFGLPVARVAEFRASVPSGDWRPIGTGEGELVHVLAVNSGGFPVPRALVAAGGMVRALTGAPAPRRTTEADRLAALEREVASLRNIVRQDHLARLDARARVRQVQQLDRRVRPLADRAPGP
jgi:hypothetical protein